MSGLPLTQNPASLPVMVWIYGGGFNTGGTSEARQDGQFLAHRNVVVVSMNYRLGIFGFFVHPALTAESPHHASGNYGLHGSGGRHRMGASATSRPSEATRTTSPSLANPPDHSLSARRWLRRSPGTSSREPSAKAAQPSTAPASALSRAKPVSSATPNSPRPSCTPLPSPSFASFRPMIW